MAPCPAPGAGPHRIPPIVIGFLASGDSFAPAITYIAVLARKGTAVHLVDVREAHEREQVSIGGLHIPLAQLEHLGGRCLSDAPVVLYCQSGLRSQRGAVQVSRQWGRSDIFSLQGGISAFLGSDLYPELMAKLTLCQCSGLLRPQ